jgi:probable HAF family extracellular repeat protein
MTALGTLGGMSSEAVGINDSGQIVGHSHTASGQMHAFLYSGGVMKDLGTLGGASSRALAINESGQIVGSSDTASGQGRAFLYLGGAMTDLGTLPGNTDSVAHGINNNGQIVGSLSTTGTNQYNAFLYNPGPNAVLSVNPISLISGCVRGQNSASQIFTV